MGEVPLVVSLFRGSFRERRCVDVGFSRFPGFSGDKFFKQIYEQHTHTYIQTHEPGHRVAWFFVGCQSEGVNGKRGVVTSCNRAEQLSRHFQRFTFGLRHRTSFVAEKVFRVEKRLRLRSGKSFKHTYACVFSVRNDYPAICNCFNLRQEEHEEFF